MQLKWWYVSFKFYLKTKLESPCIWLDINPANKHTFNWSYKKLSELCHYFQQARQTQWKYGHPTSKLLTFGSLNKIPTQALQSWIHTRKDLLHPEQGQRSNEVVYLHYPTELQITAENIHYCSTYRTSPKNYQKDRSNLWTTKG